MAFWKLAQIRVITNPTATLQSCLINREVRHFLSKAGLLHELLQAALASAGMSNRLKHGTSERLEPWRLGSVCVFDAASGVGGLFVS